MYENGNFTGYSAYDVSGYTKQEEPKQPAPGQKSNAGSVIRKIFLSISLGLFFGMFAGIGFYAVQQGTDLFDNQKEGVQEEQVLPAINEAGQNGVLPVAGAGNVSVVQSDISDIVEEVMPAMVSIVNNYTYTSSFWGHTYSQEEAASGSGIIVAESEDELLIVSNNHVVEDADKLDITFIDGTVAEAKIKGLDSDMDLAVIAVPLDALTEETRSAIAIAALGDSDTLRLGEPVIAIGNALGYGQSVTNGIVSALNREITLEDGHTGTFIQTNAAINPGNSGGALLNYKGEVIGINSNKLGDVIVEGMGYAIPISAANPIIGELMERQTRDKIVDGQTGYMGISLQEVNAQISGMYNMPQGIYVLAVTEGSAAEKAGIMTGDIIVKLDGQKVLSYAELQELLQYYAAGETTSVTVMRPERGEYVEYKLSITFDAKPE